MQDGRNFYREASPYRCGRYSAQIFQENSSRQSYQRYTTLFVACMLCLWSRCGSSSRKILAGRCWLWHTELWDMPQHHRGDTSCFWRPSAQTIPERSLCTSGHERIPSADGSNLFTPPIILLQTVIEKVRHRSLPLYNRLKAVIKTEEKRVWVFYNEYRSSVNILSFRFDLNLAWCRETAIVREDGESPNDRNDRGQ
jgi:hypothetical protein